MGVLHENGTFMCCSPLRVREVPPVGHRRVYFIYCDSGISRSFSFTSPNDKTLAQTVTYFMKWGEMDFPKINEFEISAPRGTFDFRAAGSPCLARLLQLSLPRKLKLINLQLSVEQSIILATRPYPIKLALSGGRFEDDGSAFTKCVKKRKASFGSFVVFKKMPVLSKRSMCRLLQAECIDVFKIYDLSGTIAPLFSGAKSVIYSGSIADLDTDLEQFNIATRNLSLTLDARPRRTFPVMPVPRTFPAEPVIAFLRRLAQYCHLIELKIKFCPFCNLDIPDAITRELFGTVLANVDLQILDLVGWFCYIQLTKEQFTELFECVKVHNSLRTLRINVHDKEGTFGPSFIYLRRLLSCNRKLVAT